MNFHPKKSGSSHHNNMRGSPLFQTNDRSYIKIWKREIGLGRGIGLENTQVVA
jgi:hypothetical protein